MQDQQAQRAFRRWRIVVLAACLSGAATGALADGGHGRNAGGPGPGPGPSGAAGLSGGGPSNGPGPGGGGPGPEGPSGTGSTSGPPAPATMSLDPSGPPDRTASAPDRPAGTPDRPAGTPERAANPAPDNGRAMGIDGRSGRDPDQDLARSAAIRGDVIPLDRILRKAADFVPGDVLDVRLRSDRRGPWIYEIRMLSNDGRIRIVVIDATRNDVIEVRRP